MVWTPRVSIPSTVGRYELNLSSPADRNTIEAKHGENCFTVQIAIVSWIALLGDSPLEAKPRDVIRRFEKELKCDYLGVCNRLSELADALSRSAKHTSVGDAIIIDGFLHDFKRTPVFREYLRFVRTGDPRLLRYLMSFLEFGKKIGYVDKTLDATALRGWREVEERLESLEFPTYVPELAKIIEWMFSRGWDDSEFWPKFGSGAVSEKGVWGINRKCREFSLDPALSVLYDADNLLQTLPRWETSKYEYVDGRWMYDGVFCAATPAGAHAKLACETESVARLKFVPKDLKKSRSICIEPNGYMWAQQGVLRWYETWLEDGILKRHVFLEDQTKNQMACWHGSMSATLATIDLSSASDSVSLRLVEATFPEKVRKHLLATRSRYVKIPGVKTPVVAEKFAPMGSATCFPTQCTIFSAVVFLVSVAQSYGRDIWNGGTISDLNLDLAYYVMYGAPEEHRHYKHLFVYGDDIICDKQVVSNVIRTLQDLGFKVNEDKSYTDETAYRESCGKHYFNGYDVTPLKLKIKPVYTRMNGAALEGVIDAANRAAEYGYKHLYSALVNVALRYPLVGYSPGEGRNNEILFVGPHSEESFAIRSRQPRNDHLKRRWYDRSIDPNSIPNIRDEWSHQLYQRDELQSLTLCPDWNIRVSKEFDTYFHTSWWGARRRSHEDGSDSEPTSRTDCKGYSIGFRWTEDQWPTSWIR